MPDDEMPVAIISKMRKVKYHYRPIYRLSVEIRFIINTLMEALLHPLSTSVIDKGTGRLISRD